MCNCALVNCSANRPGAGAGGVSHILHFTEGLRDTTGGRAWAGAGGDNSDVCCLQSEERGEDSVSAKSWV